MRLTPLIDGHSSLEKGKKNTQKQALLFSSNQDQEEKNKVAAKSPTYLVLALITSLFSPLIGAADFWKTPSATESMKGKVMGNLMTEQGEPSKHLGRAFVGLGDLLPYVNSNNTLILGSPVMEDPWKAGWLLGIKTILKPMAEKRPDLKVTLAPLFIKPPMGKDLNVNVFALVGDKIGPLDTRVDVGVNYTRMHPMTMEMGNGMNNMAMMPHSVNSGMTMSQSISPQNMPLTETVSPVLTVEQPLGKILQKLEPCAARGEFNFKPAKKGGYSILGARCALPKNPVVDGVSAGFDTKNNAPMFFINKMF